MKEHKEKEKRNLEKELNPNLYLVYPVYQAVYIY